MSVYYDFTNEGLKKMLSELLAQPDFLTVSKRDIVSSFLCSHLHFFGYVAMTHEELILRAHYDYRGKGYHEGPGVRTVDLFKHVDQFVQLGIAPQRPDAACNMVKSVVKRMVDMGILVLGKESDGQMDFTTTRLANSKLSLEEAVWLLQQKMK